MDQISRKGKAVGKEFVCSKCGTVLSPKAPVYCGGCLGEYRLQFDQLAKDCQKRVDEMQSKILDGGSKVAKFAELLRQKDQIIAELEQKVQNCSERYTHQRR